MFSPDKAATIEMEELGVAVHGQSFGSPAGKKNLARKYPSAIPGYFNIGLLHTSVDGREGHEPYAPCGIDDLRSKEYDYWAMGHAHQREVVLEQPFAVFPGNTQGRHIRECGPKGCMLVGVDESGQAALEFMPLDVVRWARIEIDASAVGEGYDVVDGFTDRLGQLLQENGNLPLIARVEIRGSSQAHAELAGDIERWVNEFRSAAIDASGGNAYIEKVKVRTTSLVSGDVVKSQAGPIGELNRYLDEIQSDPDRLLSLGQTLDDLVRKMPRELKEGGDSIKLDDPDWIAGMIEQVRSMLTYRLMRKGDSR
jgi:DNA repair exonuclease SbcCD nuclease subunit